MTNVLEHIDSYFQGELSPDEKRKFEQAILDDPALAREVAFYVSSVNMLKENHRLSVLDAVPELGAEELVAKKSLFRKWYEQQQADGTGRSDTDLADNVRPMHFSGQEKLARTGTDELVFDHYGETAYSGSLDDSRGGILAPVRSLLNKWKMPAAAAIVIMVVMSIYLLNSGPSHMQMADTFIKTELADVGVSMGTVADSMMIAKNMYNASNFAGALAMFEKILRSNPSEVKALELAGISALQLKRYPIAYQHFNDLSKIDGLISNPGNFYAAVTLMKQNRPGDQEKAKQLLEQVVSNNLAYSDEAKEWLENW